MELKYLFEATFEDGSKFLQDVNDTSKLDPSRSSFYDLLQTNKKIVLFSIGNYKESYSVNLITGKFTINGVEFEVEGLKQMPLNFPEYKLIYFRQHRHEIKMTQSTNDIGQTEEKPEELNHKVTYCIGWEVNVNGRDYKHILKFS